MLTKERPSRCRYCVCIGSAHFGLDGFKQGFLFSIKTNGFSHAGVPIPAALKALKGKPVLTVSFAEDFLAGGGLLQLYRVDSRLGFEIARETARATGLMLDSRVLIQSRPVPIQP